MSVNKRILLQEVIKEINIIAIEETDCYPGHSLGKEQIPARDSFIFSSPWFVMSLADINRNPVLLCVCFPTPPPDNPHPQLDSVSIWNPFLLSCHFYFLAWKFSFIWLSTGKDPSIKNKSTELI